MADFPSLDHSPYFKTFNSHRVGNVARFRQNLMRQTMHGSNRNYDRNTPEYGDMQHYPILRGILTKGNPPWQPQQQIVRSGPHGQAVSGANDQPGMHGRAVSGANDQPGMHHQAASAMPFTMPPMMAQHLSQAMPAPAEPQMPPMPQNALPQAQPLPPQPPEPTHPQTAAERFRLVNQGLPDGVHFEPLDDDIKAILKNMGMDNQQQQPPPAPAVATPINAGPIPSGSVPVAPVSAAPSLSSPFTGPLSAAPAAVPMLSQAPTAAPLAANEEAASPESAELLERMIQDERNAAEYYQYLSGVAPTADIQNNLLSISKDCEVWGSQYKQMLQSLHGRTFEAESKQINTSVAYEQGIKVAILEERKILEAMSKLIDLLDDRKSGYAIQNLINKRMISLNWLQWAMFQID